MAKSEIVFTFEDIKKASLPQAVSPSQKDKQQNSLQGIKVSFNNSNSDSNINYQDFTGNKPTTSTTVFTKSANLLKIKELGSFSNSSTTPTNNFSTFEKATTNVSLDSIKNPISKLARFASTKHQDASVGGMIVYQGSKPLDNHKDNIDYSSNTTQQEFTPVNYEVSTKGAESFTTTTTGKLISASIKNVVEKNEKGNILSEQIFVPKFVNGTIKTVEKSTPERKSNTQTLFSSGGTVEERFNAFNNLTSSKDFYKNTSAQGITTNDNGFLNNIVNSSDSRKAWVKSFTLSNDTSVYNVEQTSSDIKVAYGLEYLSAVNSRKKAQDKYNKAETASEAAHEKSIEVQRDVARLKSELTTDASQRTSEAVKTYIQKTDDLAKQLNDTLEEDSKATDTFFNNIEKAQDTFIKNVTNSDSLDEVETASKKYDETVSKLKADFAEGEKERSARQASIEKEAEQADKELNKTLDAIDKNVADTTKELDKAIEKANKDDMKAFDKAQNAAEKYNEAVKKEEAIESDESIIKQAEALGLTMKNLNQTQLKYSESVGFQNFLNLNTPRYGSAVRDDGWQKSFSSIFSKNTAKEIGNTFADLGSSLLAEIAKQNLNGWIPRSGKLAADSYERFKTFTRNVGYSNAIGFIDFDEYYYNKPGIIQILGKDGIEFVHTKRYYLPDTKEIVISDDDFASYTRTVRFVQDESEHAESVQDAKYTGSTSTVRKANLAITDSNIFIEKDYEQLVADTISDHKPTKIDLVERALINLVQPSNDPNGKLAFDSEGYIHEMISKNPLLSTSQYHLFIKPLKETNNINSLFYNDDKYNLSSGIVSKMKNLDKTTRWLQSNESHYNLDNQGNFTNEKTHYSTLSDWKNFRIKGLPIGAFERQSSGVNYGVQLLNLIPNLQASSEYKAEITIICDRALDELEYLNRITGVGICKKVISTSERGIEVFDLSAVSDSDYSYCDDAYLRIRNGRDLMKAFFEEELNRSLGADIYYKVPVFHFHNFRIINTGNSFKFEHSNTKPFELKATVTWSKLSIDWEEASDIYYSEIQETTTNTENKGGSEQ